MGFGLSADVFSDAGTSEELCRRYLPKLASHSGALTPGASTDSHRARGECCVVPKESFKGCGICRHCIGLQRSATIGNPRDSSAPYCLGWTVNRAVRA